MNEFYQGVFAAIGMLGGVCAFNYWMFGMMEKRIEDKIDLKIGGFGDKLNSLKEDIHLIALEVKEERKAREGLYNFVLNASKK